MKDKQDDDSKNSGFNETNSDHAKKTNQEDREKIRKNLEFYRKSPENNPLNWQPGQRLQDNPEYKIETRLNEGGFGIVYIAKDEKDKIVVIKIVSEYALKSVTSEKQQRALRQEFMRLARCSHANIVEVLDLIFEVGQPCLVMEYIPGDNLRQRVEKQGIIPEKEAIDYTVQIGQALIYLHKRDRPILHRDVKPSNIIIRQDTSQAVLIDFGTSRECNPGENPELTGFISPGYTPIEQSDSDDPQGPYTDIYALAATLYFMLTKKVPNTPLKRLSGIAKFKKDNLTSPKDINPQISEELNLAIVKGVELLVNNRPQSVQEWLDLLPKPENNKKTVKSSQPQHNTPQVSRPPSVPNAVSNPPTIKEQTPPFPPKSSPPQHNPPQRSRPAPVPPPVPNPPVIQQEKLPSSPVTDWGLYLRTALMGAGVWLIAIAIFNSPSIANKGVLIGVGIILWGIALFWKNHSSLGQKILQHIFSLLSSCLIYLFFNFLKLEASSIIFLAPISAILAMTMMAMAELFITSDSEES